MSPEEIAEYLNNDDAMDEQVRRHPHTPGGHFLRPLRPLSHSRALAASPRRRVRPPPPPPPPPPPQHGDAATTDEAGEAVDPSSINTDVDTHFICFTEVGGCLYELDGRKAFPINHGSSSPETMLADACKVVKGFMERDPEEQRFTIVALAPAVDM